MLLIRALRNFFLKVQKLQHVKKLFFVLSSESTFDEVKGTNKRGKNKSPKIYFWENIFGLLYNCICFLLYSGFFFKYGVCILRRFRSNGFIFYCNVCCLNKVNSCSVRSTQSFLRSIIFWNAANASFLLLYFTALNIQYPFLLRHSTGTKVRISEENTK